MLTVGESTGGIPFALQQLSENLQRRREVAEKVKKALVVPAISMVVAFFAGIVMVTYSIPALTSMLSDFKGEGELPTATRALITISGFLQAYTTYIIGTPIAVAVLGGAYSRTPRGKGCSTGWC
jgi:type II secretory pathway component PulF